MVLSKNNLDKQFFVHLNFAKRFQAFVSQSVRIGLLVTKPIHVTTPFQNMLLHHVEHVTTPCRNMLLYFKYTMLKQVNYTMPRAVFNNTMPKHVTC